MPDQPNLVSVLSWLATSAGAGVAGSWLFTQIRAMIPPSAPAWILVAVNAPAWARVTVFALTALIAIVASAALAAAQGQPVAPAVDAATAVIVGQLWHARSLARTA
jgi:hypothetical protein